MTPEVRKECERIGKNPEMVRLLVVELLARRDMEAERDEQAEEVDMEPPLGDLQAALRKLERAMIKRALREARNNITVAADLLCVKRTTLNFRMHTLGIPGPRMDVISPGEQNA